MDRSKLSATDAGYGEDIHQVVDNIPEPNDDSITLSSFENSQMTYSKSFNRSKKSRKRDRENVSNSLELCAIFVFELLSNLTVVLSYFYQLH